MQTSSAINKCGFRQRGCTYECADCSQPAVLISIRLSFAAIHVKPKRSNRQDVGGDTLAMSSLSGIPSAFRIFETSTCMIDRIPFCIFCQDEVRQLAIFTEAMLSDLRFLIWAARWLHHYGDQIPA
jgi:hypothetical protein